MLCEYSRLLHSGRLKQRAVCHTVDLFFYHKFKNLQNESTVSAVRDGDGCPELITFICGLNASHCALKISVLYMCLSLKQAVFEGVFLALLTPNMVMLAQLVSFMQQKGLPTS